MTYAKRFVSTTIVRRCLGAAVFAALGAFTFTPRPAQAGVFVSVSFAPPVLPVYVQPAIPGPGYIWTPGYWAYDEDGGYYWVPGTWVLPPYAGALWTPGYWGWAGGVYVFHTGYWGPHIGFYGGINYGFGYTGVGYWGGYWNSGRFYYNRTVNNVTNNITNVYNKTVINNVNVRNVSYNGGQGGVVARANTQEMAASREQHVAAVAEQTHQASLAAGNQQLRASVNHGTPPIAATARAGTFENGVAARTATTANAPATQRATTGPVTSAPARAHSATLRSASFAPQAQGSATANRISTPAAGQPAGGAGNRQHADNAARHEARAVHTESAQRAPNPSPQVRAAPAAPRPAAPPRPAPQVHPANNNHGEHEAHNHR